MASYNEIRKTSRAQHAKAYANGGAVRGAGRAKSAKTVINIVTPPAASGGAAAMPAPPIAGAAAGPAAMPAPPVPPAAANAALGAMGGAPAFANGGAVRCANGGRAKKASKLAGGAASGMGRLRHEKNPGKQ